MLSGSVLSGSVLPAARGLRSSLILFIQLKIRVRAASGYLFLALTRRPIRAQDNSPWK